jgi:hypothetical protein
MQKHGKYLWHILHIIPISLLIYEIIQYNKENNIKLPTKDNVNPNGMMITLYAIIIFICGFLMLLATSDSKKIEKKILLFCLIHIILYIPCAAFRIKRLVLSYYLE